MTLPSPLNLDVLGEHLDEAAFARQLWEEALRSPNYTLQEISEGPEERMLANLDGLVVGGQRAAKELLIPALSDADSNVAFAAAFGLLTSEEGDYLDEVLIALESAEPEPRAAIRRALGVAPVPALGQRLAALAPKSRAIQGDLLEVLGYLRIDSGVSLEPLASSIEPVTQAVAIRLACFQPDRLDAAVVQRALKSSHPAVRAAALETAMVSGARNAFAAAEATVAEKGPAFSTAALILGLGGDERSVASLLPGLADKLLQRSAAFGLGFSGRISAAEALIGAMANPAVAPVAAEAFGAIVGLRMEKQFVNDTLRASDNSDDGDTYGPEHDLPAPNSAAILAWWKEAKKKLVPSERWLQGQPWGAEAILRGVEHGSARRREGLALDLAIRTSPRVQIAWDALSARQTADLKQARASASRISLKSLRAPI